MTGRVERIGDATLYLGDCLEILPTLPKVDALITDPPYGVNLGNHAGASETRPGYIVKGRYESYEDTEENFVQIVAPAILRALNNAERGVVFSSGKNLWHLPRAIAVGGVYLPAGCGRNPWGFTSLAHACFYGTAPDLHLGAKATAIVSSDAAEKNGHPCPKPDSWMRWAVDLASRKHETVLDPFMGSGSTGVAAVQLGRKFIGIEIEPRYFDIACERIENAQRQQRLFVEASTKPQQASLEIQDVSESARNVTVAGRKPNAATGSGG